MAYRAYQWRLNNPERRASQRRIYRIRKTLRDRGFLPPVGVDMTEEQKELYEQIGREDYTYWESVKLNGTPGKKLHNGGNQEKTIKKMETRSFEYLIWDRARQSSKERNLEFNLDVEDIVIPEYCPLLGIKLTFVFSKETRHSYYSIDRIDSSKGYIKGNVQIISLRANTMKNDATNDELLIFARNIINIYENSL
jgi:hypothetical protein